MTSKTNQLEVKLASGNYSSWNAKLYSLLVLNNCQDVLDFPEPENPIEDGEDVDADNDEQAAKIAAHQAWKAKSTKVWAYIQLNVDENNSQRINETRCGKEAWELLKEYHKRDSVGHVQRLQEKISSLKKRDNVSMERHLNELFALVARYREAGGEFSDTEFSNRILNSIRSTNKTLCDAISVQTEKIKDPWKLRLWLIDYAMNDEEEQEQVAQMTFKVQGQKKKKRNDRGQVATSRPNFSSMPEVAQDDSDFSSEDEKPKIKSEVHLVKNPSERNPYATYTCNECRQKGHIRVNCPFVKMSVDQLEQMLAEKKNKAKAAYKGQNYTNCVMNSEVLNAWIID
jgi:hypothetical protein